jgi:NAD(P)-dependent dehydrogenase (short-subunit alcohol dehydrogenase family)
VVIASRSQQKTAQALNQLRALSSSARVETLPLDLGSLESIRSFVNDFKTHDFPPLRALVCNAGIQVVSGTSYTRDGFEITFGVNHLGHFLLTHLLLNSLVAPARIVMVSSDTHDPAQSTGMPEPHYLSAVDLAWPEKNTGPAKNRANANIIGRRRYTTSKLCNVLFTYELSRRLQEEGMESINVNAYNPGLMPGTGLARDYNPLMRFAWNVILPAIHIISKSVIPMNNASDSGKALARLLLDPTLEAVSARYFSGMKELPSSNESYDRQKALDLWRTSVDLVKLTQAETPLSIDQDTERGRK